MEKKRIIMMGTAGAVVITAIVGGVVLMNAMNAPKEEAVPQPSIDIAAEATSAAEGRDAQRYRDISALRIALNGYSGSNGRFPVALVDLAPTYLATIPVDPGTGAPYGYVVKDGAFTLSFALEQGAVSLAAGDHFLTPRGFDLLAVAIAERETNETSSTIVPPKPGSETVEPSATNPDTDGDGLDDSEELGLRTDSDKADTDRDGIADGDEVHVFLSDPRNADSDVDNFSDGQELQNGFDPVREGALSAERKASINAAAESYGIHPPTNISLPLK